MSKRNVAFIKPKEPAFLARLKQEVGYKEGPTVDTKREKLPEYTSDDSEGEEQQPVIVVVNAGDLTAEEVAQAKKEAETAPADLDKKIIFKKPVKKRVQEESGGSDAKIRKKITTNTESKKHNKNKPSNPTNKGPLSFSEDLEEEYD